MCHRQLLLSLTAFLSCWNTVSLFQSSRLLAEDEIREGDILGVYVEGILGNAEHKLPTYVFFDNVPIIRIGYPIRVNGDGDISLPNLGKFEARGKIPSELLQDIEDKMVESGLVDPELEHEVVSFLNLMRRRPDNEPDTYRSKCGDVIAIVVEGITSPLGEAYPAHLQDSIRLLPCVGHPFPIDEEGMINLPFKGRVNVAGQTITEIEALIDQAYTVDLEVFQPNESIIRVSPMWVSERDERMEARYLIRPGDSVALVRGATNGWLEDAPIWSGRTDDSPPFWGIPYPIHNDGTLRLPSQDPLNVSGVPIDVLEFLINAPKPDEYTSLNVERDVMVSRIHDLGIERFGVDPSYQISPLDDLCIYGLFPDSEIEHQYFFPKDPALAPAFGVEFGVSESGFVEIPETASIDVSGLTTRECEVAILEHYEEMGLDEVAADRLQVRVIRKSTSSD